MSRSALWRQEGNAKERERQAEELYQLAVEEGRNNRARNLVPMWGPDDSFHLNPMLLQNIVKSSYFQKCCRDITDWSSLVDEIYYQVKHLEPWAVGSSKDPSTAFCLLLRLLTLRCTEKQMKLLLDHPDSPYIRGIGFLYLRYAGDPKCLWQWIEPYLFDEEEMQVAAGSAKHASLASQTMGDFVRQIFTKRDYYGTILPRLPSQMEREIQVKLLQAEKIEERAQKHASNFKSMDHFKRLGSKVMALYGDEENPIQWYEAVVDRVITVNPDTSQPLKNPKFVVTFPEYGNTETVSLGELEMPGCISDVTNIGTSTVRRGGFPDEKVGAGRNDREEGNRSRNHGRDRDRGRTDRGRGYHDEDRGYGRNRGYNNADNDRGHGDRWKGRGYDGTNDRRRRDHDNRSQQSDRRWERDRHSNRSRGGTTDKTNAALPSEDDLYEEIRRRERDTVTSSGRSAVARRPPSTKFSLLGSNHKSSSHNSSPPSYHSPPRGRSSPPAPSNQNIGHGEQASAPKKRTADELAAIQEKKRKLMAKYG